MRLSNCYEIIKRWKMGSELPATSVSQAHRTFIMSPITKIRKMMLRGGDIMCRFYYSRMAGEEDGHAYNLGGIIDWPYETVSG